MMLNWSWSGKFLAINEAPFIIGSLSLRGFTMSVVLRRLRRGDVALPRLPHETRRLSRDHNDGAKATWDANDAIDAIAATTSRSSSLRGRGGERAEDERRSSGYTCGVVALAVRALEL